jgi:hypothetical protein
MESTELPLRVSQNPNEIIENPKTPNKTVNDDDEWKENLDVSRKVSLEAAARFQKENALGPSTPMQNARIFGAKIDELEALIRLEDLEAESYARQVDTKKRANPDDEEIAGLVSEMRKNRKASAEHIKKSLQLQSERATFLESTTDANALTRTKLLETILLAPIDQALGKAEKRVHQKSCKASLIQFYDAGERGSEVPTVKMGVPVTRYKYLWCPVLQEYFTSADVSASHVAPRCLSPGILSYLTGTNIETTMLVGNGILLAERIEEQWDKGNIALIPTGSTQDPIQLKLVIINEDIRGDGYYRSNQLWDHLDGRVLKFKNDARPQKRFLYLKYAMTMLYAWRHKIPGYERLQSDIWPSRLIWASPGKHVRKSSLQSIGGLIGEHFDKTFDDEEDELSQSETSRNLMLKFRAVLDTMPTSEDEDEDDEDSEGSDYF